MADAFLELRKFVAPEFVVGAGARLLAGRYATNYGAHRILLVTDPGVLAAGWAPEVLGELQSSGLSVVVFSEVSENPPAEEVRQGAELFVAEGCDALVAVGGGSPIDCAKGIGVVASNGGAILDYEGVDMVLAPIPPLIAVPTTAGSAADVSQFAIISDRARARKVAIVTKAIVPDVSLLDPRPLVTQSAELTANAGVDALTHAIEAYLSNANSPITDLFALQALRLLSGSLRRAREEPGDLALRTQTMLACLDAGLAFSNASLGAVHAMAHALGGRTGLAHGLCNGMLLCAVVGFNFEAAPERCRDLAGALGLPVEGLALAEVRETLLEGLRAFLAGVGLTSSLSRLGLRGEEIPGLAENAARDPCLATNPRAVSRKQLEVLFAQSL